MKVVYKSEPEESEIRAMGNRFVENHIKRFRKKQKHVSKILPAVPDRALQPAATGRNKD